MGNFWDKCLFIRFSWICIWWQTLKLGKSDSFGLLKKILNMPKMDVWVTFRPKVNTFKLFSKSEHWIFLKLYLITGIKNYWFKVTVLIITKKFLYAQNAVSRPFLFSKSTFWSFLQQSFLKLYLMKGIKGTVMQIL